MWGGGGDGENMRVNERIPGCAAVIEYSAIIAGTRGRTYLVFDRDECAVVVAGRSFCYVFVHSLLAAVAALLVFHRRCRSR